jgi:hypothetical protein
MFDDTTQYCSIGAAMKLIAHPFDGDKKFIENVNVVFEPQQTLCS